MANAGYMPGAERRQQILDGAKRVFASRGYHNTNISHICSDLGIARGTLYQYFGSKKEVFSAIIEDLLERLRAVIARVPPLELPVGVRPTREQAFAYSTRSLEIVLEAVFADEDALRILVREAVGLDVDIDSILRAIDDMVVERFTRDLAVAQQAGIVRSDVDPHTAALFTLGGIQKLALDALGRDGGVDLHALAEQATRMEMTGLLSNDLD